MSKKDLTNLLYTTLMNETVDIWLNVRLLDLPTYKSTAESGYVLNDWTENDPDYKMHRDEAVTAHPIMIDGRNIRHAFKLFLPLKNDYDNTFTPNYDLPFLSFIILPGLNLQVFLPETGDKPIDVMTLQKLLKQKLGNQNTIHVLYVRYIVDEQNKWINCNVDDTYEQNMVVELNFEQFFATK